MFDDVGGKIKKYAKVVFWIGAILAGLMVLLTIIEGVNSSEGLAYAIGALIGGGIMVLFSWLGCLFVYAYGEIAEQSEMQTNLLYQLINIQSEKGQNKANGAGEVVPAWKRVQVEQEAKQEQ